MFEKDEDRQPTKQQSPPLFRKRWVRPICPTPIHLTERGSKPQIFSQWYLPFVGWLLAELDWPEFTRKFCPSSSPLVILWVRRSRGYDRAWCIWDAQNPFLLELCQIFLKIRLKKGFFLENNIYLGRGGHYKNTRR